MFIICTLLKLKIIEHLDCSGKGQKGYRFKTSHENKAGLYFETRKPRGTFLIFGVPISFTGSLFLLQGPHFFCRVPISFLQGLYFYHRVSFSDFLLNVCNECQYSVHVNGYQACE